MEEKKDQRRGFSVTRLSAWCAAVTVLGTHVGGHNSLGLFMCVIPLLGPQQSFSETCWVLRGHGHLLLLGPWQSEGHGQAAWIQGTEPWGEDPAELTMPQGRSWHMVPGKLSPQPMGELRPWRAVRVKYRGWLGETEGAGGPAVSVLVAGFMAVTVTEVRAVPAARCLSDAFRCSGKPFFSQCYKGRD